MWIHFSLSLTTIHMVERVVIRKKRLRSLNLSTLLYRGQRYDQIQIFKIVSGVEDIDVDTFFTFNDN